MVLILRDAGHTVVGTTRSAGKAETLRSLGVEPVLVDVFDAELLLRAMEAAQPDVVIHQLTDLPKKLDPNRMGAAIVRNARIREEGTQNLVAAANTLRVRRLVAQSIGWAYAPGPEPHSESDPLDAGAQGDRGTTVRGVIALEDCVLKSPPLAGLVLRYGRLYGPGTHADKPANSAPVHVDAAAYAAVLAMDRGQPGTYNIAQPNAYMTTHKARAELGWDPDFRISD